jgi:hypothetical protein
LEEWLAVFMALAAVGQNDAVTSVMAMGMVNSYSQSYACGVDRPHF